MSKPSFPFYPDNYMNDAGVRRCSAATRGIWIDLLCLMHQGVPYGYLAGPAGDHPVKFLSNWCSETIPVIQKALEELRVNGVYSATEAGTIFSRRMERDDHNRRVRGAGGKRSAENGNVPRRKVSFTSSEEAPLPPGGGRGIGKELKSKTENQILLARFQDLIATWQAPDSSGRVFPCKDVDLGFQVWESLVESGKITAATIPVIMAGLERYRASIQWRNPRYVTSVPGFLGWSNDGRPSAPKWNDTPAPAPQESEY